MPRALVTDSLSSEAQQLLAACLRGKLAPALIVQQIKTATGEEVSERTIARRKADFEAETQRRRAGREQMEDLLAAMRQGDHTASEMVNALAIEQLMRDPDGTLAADPIALQQTSIQAERVRLQAKSMAIKERQLALEEQKFAALQAREQRAIDALKGDESKLSPQDMLRKVKEIYGLKTDE
jgi:hypothetical protein